MLSIFSVGTRQGEQGSICGRDDLGQMLGTPSTLSTHKPWNKLSGRDGASFTGSIYKQVGHPSVGRVWGELSCKTIYQGPSSLTFLPSRSLCRTIRLGQTAPSGGWRHAAKGPEGMNSTKRKSVQIYYLYSLPKAGRVSVSGTFPVGTAFSPPSAPPKCHCSNYRGNHEGKLAGGQCGFWLFAAPLAFLSLFQGCFWNPWTTG